MIHDAGQRLNKQIATNLSKLDYCFSTSHHGIISRMFFFFKKCVGSEVCMGLALNRHPLLAAAYVIPKIYTGEPGRGFSRPLAVAYLIKVTIGAILLGSVIKPLNSTFSNKLSRYFTRKQLLGATITWYALQGANHLLTKKDPSNRLMSLRSLFRLRAPKKTRTSARVRLNRVLFGFEWSLYPAAASAFFLGHSKLGFATWSLSNLLVFTKWHSNFRHGVGVALADTVSGILAAGALNVFPNRFSTALVNLIGRRAVVVSTCVWLGVRMREEGRGLEFLCHLLTLHFPEAYRQAKQLIQREAAGFKSLFSRENH